MNGTSRRVLAALAALAGAAQAAPRKSFATLDRQDDATRLGVQYGQDFFDDDKLSAHRIELYGQYAGKDVGFYAQIIMTKLTEEESHDDEEDFDAPSEESVSGTAAIELGVFHVWKKPGADFVLRGGLVLPTADDDLGGLVANATTAFERLTDVADIMPNALGLRPSFSVIAGDAAFVRLDLGLDLMLDTSDDSAEAHLDGNQALGRLNVGAGVHGGGIAATAELVNLASLTSDANTWDEKLLHTAALSIGYEGNIVQPSLAFVLPLDEDIRKGLDAIVVGSVQLVGLPY